MLLFTMMLFLLLHDNSAESSSNSNNNGPSSHEFPSGRAARLRVTGAGPGGAVDTRRRASSPGHHVDQATLVLREEGGDGREWTVDLVLNKDLVTESYFEKHQRKEVRKGERSMEEERRKTGRPISSHRILHLVKMFEENGNTCTFILSLSCSRIDPII